MKALTTHFFLILLPICTTAQQNLDSLWHVWLDKEIADTIRLKAIDTYITKGMLASDPDSAIYLAMLQYEFAEEKDSKLYMSHSLNSQAKALMHKHDYVKAAELYYRNLVLSSSLNDRNEKARVLYNLGLLHDVTGEFDMSMECFNESLSIYEEQENNTGIVSVLISLGISYENIGEYTRALETFERSLDLAKSLSDEFKIAATLSNMGRVYELQGALPKAIECFSEAQLILEKLNEHESSFIVMLDIGIAYDNLGDKQVALNYFLQCLEKATELGHDGGIGYVLHNIGIIYRELGDTQKAIEYLENSLRIREVIGDKRSLAASLNGLGNVHRVMGSYETSLDYFFRSLSISESIGLKEGQASTLNNIGEVYKESGELLKALSYNNESLQIAKEIGKVVQIKSTALSLWKINKELGRYKNALDMHELYVLMRDSITSDENIKELARFEFKYEYEKKALADSLRAAAENETRELNHQVEIAQKETERNLFASSGLFVLFITYLFFQRKVNKNKLVLKEKEAAYQVELIHASISSQEKERQRIAQDLHDEVGAMLSTIKLQLNAASAKLKLVESDNPVLPAVSLIDDTITNVRRISKDLLPPTLERFGLAHALNDLSNKVSEASGIVIHTELPEETTRLETERELALYRIIQEMMNNAMKHAEATAFKLSLSEENGQLLLSFSDNGKGFDLKASKFSRSGQTGLGLKNLENRVGVARGEMEFMSHLGEGTSIEIRVPLNDHLTQVA